MPNINLFMIVFKVNHTVHAVCLHGVSQLLFFIYAFGWLIGFYKQLATEMSMVNKGLSKYTLFG